MTFIIKLLWSKCKQFLAKKIQELIHSKPFLAILMLAIGISHTVAYYEWQPLWRDYQSALDSRARIVVINRVEASVEEDIEPKEEEQEVVEVKPEMKQGIFSAYNAEVGQTDADPLTMANGKKVFEGAIANNCLAFGTKVEVAGKVYEVQDRMNSRYGCDHFDIFVWNHDEAIQFGRKTLAYTIQ